MRPVALVRTDPIDSSEIRIELALLAGTVWQRADSMIDSLACQRRKAPEGSSGALCYVMMFGKVELSWRCLFGENLISRNE